MNKITTVFTRRQNFELPDGRRFWLTTNSVKGYEDKWSNCLYLHFCKDDFPEFSYPSLTPCNWGKQKVRFNYSEWSLADLPWHGGITFYEEELRLENKRTYVQAGCDFQHLYDDDYRMRDCGEEIIQEDGKELAEAFIGYIGGLK